MRCRAAGGRPQRRAGSEQVTGSSAPSSAVPRHGHSRSVLGGWRFHMDSQTSYTSKLSMVAFLLSVADSNRCMHIGSLAHISHSRSTHSRR